MKKKNFFIFGNLFLIIIVHCSLPFPEKKNNQKQYMYKCISIIVILSNIIE